MVFRLFHTKKANSQKHGSRKEKNGADTYGVRGLLAALRFTATENQNDSEEKWVVVYCKPDIVRDFKRMGAKAY
jgi:hypothetical protein